MPDLFVQDPDEDIDYVRDWAAAGALVDDDTITASTWTADDGITADRDSNTDTTATIWISGGTEGVRYGVTNHIVTAAGREFDHTLYFQIRAK